MSVHPIIAVGAWFLFPTWRQDHNGSSHQDPGFTDNVANKKADTVRINYPPPTRIVFSLLPIIVFAAGIMST